jgi:hypothetical protein
MSGLSLKIAASPDSIAELSSLLDKSRDSVPVSHNRSAPYKDFSIIEVILTAATTQAIGVVFSLLKDFIAEKLKKDRGHKGFAIEIDGATIEIKTESDLGRLEEIARKKKFDAGDVG